MSSSGLAFSRVQVNNMVKIINGKQCNMKYSMKNISVMVFTLIVRHKQNSSWLSRPKVCSNCDLMLRIQKEIYSI